MENRVDKARIVLIGSLFLFTLSGIVGIVPLIAAVTEWHLACSKKEERGALSAKLHPWGVGMVVAGYLILCAVAVYFIINRNMFTGNV